MVARNETQHSVEDTVAIALLTQKVLELEKNIDKAHKDLAEIKEQKESALRWGIALLGTAVISMGIWIFQLFEKLVK